MSYVLVSPEMVAGVTADVARIGSTISAANAAAAAPTTQVLVAAGDEVSAAIAGLFGTHAQQYQALSAQAAAFHTQFVQALTTAGGAYAGASAKTLTAIGGRSRSMTRTTTGWCTGGQICRQPGRSCGVG